jgi:predicted phosphodiesterase
VKLLIVSDIHANWAALQAVLTAEPDCENVLCLGDLVDYGPQPVECLAWAIAKLQEGGWFLQGNHDWSVAHDADARCSKPYVHLAEATRAFTRSLLGERALDFLRTMPAKLAFSFDGKQCLACHATPRDPLFRYFNHEDPHEVRLEVESAGAPDYLFLGHTHLPCDVPSRFTRIINPGSVGQPKDRNPAAAYVVWNNGQIHFRRADYDIEEVERSFTSSGLHHHDVRMLMAVLRSGGRLPDNGR